MSFQFDVGDLQQQRAHKILSAKEICEKGPNSTPPRPMSKEECEIVDRYKEEIESLGRQIEAQQDHNQRSNEIKRLVDDLENPVGRKSKPDDPQNKVGQNGDIVAVSKFDRIPASARPSRALEAFKARGGESRDDAERRAYRAGMWLRATLFRDQSAQHWCANNGLGVDVRNAMATTSNTDGGALVPEEMSRAIIDLREQYGIFRQYAQVMPMGRDVMLVPRRLGGITIAPVGEGVALGESNPTFNQVQLTAKKCGGLTRLSTEVAEDAVIDLAEWIAREFAYGFANFEDTAGFTGDGTSTYMGIRGLTNLLTTASSLTGAAAAISTHDTFAEIDNVDLTTVMSKLPQYARQNAKWYCSTVAADLIFHRLQAVAGGNNVQTLQGSTGDSYLGYPIVISQVLPTSTSTINGTAMLFFGDLSMAATLGDRREVRVQRSDERYFDTDQIGIKGTERIDIVVHDIGSTSVAGPIVGLMGTT